MQDSMRRVLIDRLLSDKSVVTLQELQDVLKVSIPTIKRDLRYMRKELKALARRMAELEALIRSAEE